MRDFGGGKSRRNGGLVINNEGFGRRHPFFHSADISVPHCRDRLDTTMRLVIVQRLAQLTDAFGQVLFVDFVPFPEPLDQCHGVLARAIEGWQSSFIVNLSTGQPAPITSSYVNASSGLASPTGLYGNSVPDIVGRFPRDGKVNWNGNFGSYLGSSFARVSDPQCSAVATELKSVCTLQAVTDASSGQILLQNPKPGTRGSLGLASLNLPGSWSFDASMSKAVHVTESKSLQFRLDSTNVFNHPVPSTPIINVNGTTPFGSIQDKGTQRRFFKGSVRLNF